MDDRTREELGRLARRRWRVGGVLTAAMMIGYFGFIFVVAFAKPTAGALVADGRISVGILLGASVIVLAPVLTSIYVRWANRRYDPELAALRERTSRSDDGAA